MWSRHPDLNWGPTVYKNDSLLSQWFSHTTAPQYNAELEQACYSHLLSGNFSIAPVSALAGGTV